MYIRKDDKIIVLSGKDKGKTGKVLKSIPSEGMVVVEGVNIVKKHIKKNRSGKAGEVIEKSLPIDASKVALVDSKTGKPTRVRFEMKDGKKVRIAVKSGQAI